VTITATDNQAAAAITRFTYAITNVAPTATLNAPASIVYGHSLNVSLTGAWDASADDAASLHYAFGYALVNASPLSDALYSGSGTTASASFASLNAGTYFVFARVIDKDGGYHEYAQPVTVDQADAEVTIHPYSGIYDAAPHNLSGSVTGLDAGGAALGSSLTFGSSFTDAPGGTGTWNFEGGTNYLDESGTAAVTIGQATPTVSVIEAGGHYTGSVSGLNNTPLGTPTFQYYLASDTAFASPLPGAPASAGRYVVVGSYAATGNYASASASASFSIIMVTSLADNITLDGSVTLREAIEAANNDLSVDGSPPGSASL
jgi:hypothetical protein